MAYDYNSLYASTPSALGAPSQVFIDFFNRQTKNKLRVLDVGCGQGRDALMIARHGHSVIGVDISPSGISDLNKAAQIEALDIEGIAADITTFTPEGLFDVLLIDRTLHMLSPARHLPVLDRLAEHVAPNGWVLIADERANIQGMMHVFQTKPQNWEIDRNHGGYLFLHRM